MFIFAIDDSKFKEVSLDEKPKEREPKCIILKIDDEFRPKKNGKWYDNI